MFSKVNFLTFCFLIQAIVAASNDIKIVGGNAVSIENAPYQATLLRYGSLLCGASILTSKYVLTAAHCVQSSMAYSQIRVGSAYLRDNGQIYEIDQWFSHPRYDEVNLDFDVAIIKVVGLIEFSSTVAPIPLASKDLKIPDGDLVRVTGWGATSEGGYISNQLQEVYVPVVSQQECKEAYDLLVDITDRMICAGNVTNGGKDSCQGDSGGPLTYNGTVVGIVSFGLGCARPYYPGVYSRVSVFRPWLDALIQGVAAKEDTVVETVKRHRNGVQIRV